MNKNTIYIKNSSKDVNFGLHNLKVVIRTDGGRIYIDRHYIAKFGVMYDDKSRKVGKQYKNEITLTLTEPKESYS